MKAVAFSVLALCLALTASYAESPGSAPPPRLAGIVSVAKRPCVVLEVAGRSHSQARLFILSEGQADEGVEVEKIAPDKGNVELVWQGTNTTVRLNNTTNLPVPGIVFEDAGLGAVLQLFAQFTNRTLLRWPSLPAPLFNLRASTKNQADAAQVLAQALVAKELSLIPDGEKFLMIVPKALAAVVKPHAPSAKSPASSGTKPPAATPGSDSSKAEVMAPGLIDFRGADVIQVAEVYSALLGRKLDHGERPPAGGTISLTTQTSLTTEEALYAIETLLNWSGIKLVPTGESELKAVRAEEK